MVDEQAQHALAVVLAAARGQPRAEHGLVAAVVHARPEDETGVVARTLDRPAGERARHLGDVRLRVAAVHAERVQLHQLARVVLVQPRLPATLGAPRGHGEVRPGGEPVVQVEEHRRMARAGADEVGKAAQRVRADDVALVGRDVPADVALRGEHVEVVEPEVDHDLLELALTLDRAEHLRGLELRRDPEGPFLGRIQLHHLLACQLARLEFLPELRFGSRVVAERLRDRQAERRERRQRPLRRGVGDRLRVELALDPRVDADRPHPLEVAGSRTERETIQHMEDPPVVRQGRGAARWLLPQSARAGAGAGRGDAATGQRAEHEEGDGEPPHLGASWPWSGRGPRYCRLSRSRSSGVARRHCSRSRSRSSGGN